MEKDIRRGNVKGQTSIIFKKWKAVINVEERYHSFS